MKKVVVIFCFRFEFFLTLIITSSNFIVVYNLIINYYDYVKHTMSSFDISTFLICLVKAIFKILFIIFLTFSFIVVDSCLLFNFNFFRLSVVIFFIIYES